MSLPVSVQAGPLAAAVRRMRGKTPVAARLNSEQWSRVPLALRERATFSARLVQADVVQRIHDLLTHHIDQTRTATARGDRLVNRDTFMVEMRRALAAAKYKPPRGKEGTIKDHGSLGRMRLIFDTNREQALEYARWLSGQDEAILDEFPCQELYRLQARMVPRDWIRRWHDKGGPLNPSGRLIARKDDPIWTRISRFGTPWPPFDFRSGMSVRDVDRRTAQQLGIIKADEKVERPDYEFNRNLQASVRGMEPWLIARLMAKFPPGSVQLSGDTLHWSGGRWTSPVLALRAEHRAGVSAGDAADLLGIEQGLDRLSAVMHLPAEGTISVFDHTMPVDDPAKILGFFWHGGQVQHADGTTRPQPRQLAINDPQQPDRRVTLAHEVGHLVDNALAGGAPGDYLTDFIVRAEATRKIGTPIDPADLAAHQDVDELFKAIFASDQYQMALSHDAKTGKVYWAKPRELFARAFAQWAALETQDEAMLAVIKANAGLTQWEEADWTPVGAKLEKLLSDRRIK